MLDKDALWRGRSRDYPAQGVSPYIPPKYGSPSSAYEIQQRSNNSAGNRSSAPPFSGVGLNSQFTPSRGGQLGDVGSRIVSQSRHQVSYSYAQPSVPPFSTNSSMTREELDSVLHRQRQMEFLSSVNQQLQARKSREAQASHEREREKQQRLADLDRQRLWEQSERDRKRSLLVNYRQALDSQSGQAEKQQFEASARVFYGVDDAPNPSNSRNLSKDFRESVNRFYGVDEDPSIPPLSTSLTNSPSRQAKTFPKTIVSDPITGAVRNVPASRQRILSLGNQRPMYVAGKINDSPPPPSVFNEQPNFGKKIPRKVFFNPLTGERHLIGAEDVRSSVDNPFRRHYENSSYYQRFQEDFLR